MGSHSVPAAAATDTVQVHWSGDNFTADDSTHYHRKAGGSSADTAESSEHAYVPAVTGTLTNFRTNRGVAGNANANHKLRLDGVNTSLENIMNGVTDAVDTDTVAYTAGEEVTVSFKKGSGVASTGEMYCSVEIQAG